MIKMRKKDTKELCELIGCAKRYEFANMKNYLKKQLKKLMAKKLC